MSLLKVIKKGLKKDELAEMKKSLNAKKTGIQRQINLRESEIELMKKDDEIALPAAQENAVDKLNKTLVDINADYKAVVQAWVNNESAANPENLVNPKIAVYEKELIPLKALLKAFPTDEEIVNLKK